MTKQISIKEVLWCVFGSVRPYAGLSGSLPATVVKNATVAVNDEYAMSGDIDIEKYAENIAMIAQLFGVEIKVFSENNAWDNRTKLVAAEFIWTSKTPRLWYGECFDQKMNCLKAPQYIEDVFPVLKKIAANKLSKSKKSKVAAKKTVKK